MLGTEAALYVPSGTMSNQLAVRAHCGPGDEFLCDSRCHIFNNEQGAYAQLFGVAANPLVVESRLPTVDQLAAQRRQKDLHCTRSRLLWLENTLNAGSGCVLPFDRMAELCRWAAEYGMARHLDGARLFNAAVASGIPAADWTAHFDTVSVCFSKGLGAPVGSALCGTQELIDRARRTRKALGGGMRQAGVIAAGAIYALDHHVDRLAEDHANARKLATGLSRIPGISIDPEALSTNLVFFTIEASNHAELTRKIDERGVLLGPRGGGFCRMVTHADVTSDDVDYALDVIESTLREYGRG